jgi:hypothetical protein
MENILEVLGLGTLKHRFAEERIEPEIVIAMSDGELTRLGVSTMGDRIRLRQRCRASADSASTQCTAGQSTLNSEDTELSGNSSAGPSLSSIASERSRLFNPRHSSATSRKRKVSRGRTWTVQMICLADRLQTKIPNSIEKEILCNAGLGLKKIKFDASDNAQEVVNRIMSEEKADHGEPIGFPQLRQSGGLELLRCLRNCRELHIIDCPWSVSSLKATVGSQCKIYVRPIQKNLSTTPIKPDVNVQVKEKCQGCNQEFILNELRSHLYTCTAGILSSDSSDESDFRQQRQIQSVSSVGHVDIDNDSDLTTTSLEIFEQTTSAEQQSINIVQQSIDSDENPDINDVINSPIVIEDDYVHGPMDMDKLDNMVRNVSEQCKNTNIDSNKEILRALQSKILKGRRLDIEREDECPQGETNYIHVDRNNLLETALDEIGALENPLLTLEIQFYGEVK